MAQSEVISRKFVATVDRYEGVVVRCEQDKHKGPYSVTVKGVKDGTGPWELKDYPGPVCTEDKGVVSVTTGEDGKLSVAFEITQRYVEPV